MKNVCTIVLLSAVFGSCLCAPHVGRNQRKTVISYAVLCHNETDCLEQLLDFLAVHKEPHDEIVLIDDESTNERTLSIIQRAKDQHHVVYARHALNKDFGQQRNLAISLCRGDYIFFIDADELPTQYLMEHVRAIVSSGADVYAVPRIHWYHGVTGIPVNERGWAFWPSYNWRILRNRIGLHYEGKVHETIAGEQKREHVPAQEEYALTEHKYYDKWRSSHIFYRDCFKEWFADSIEAGDAHRARSILYRSPVEHVAFLKDPLVQRALDSRSKIDRVKVQELVTAFFASNNQGCDSEHLKLLAETLERGLIA